MPKIDLDTLDWRSGSSYPAPHDAGFEGRRQKRLGDSAGLTQFGVNLVRLAPGAMSSLRHWHEEQDEFLVMTEGTLVLVEDTGETQMTPGDCAAFKAGVANGHHLVNRSFADAAFVVVGTRTRTETGWYSDVDMKVEADAGVMQFTRRDGSPVRGLSEVGGGALSEAPTEFGIREFEILSAQLSNALIEGDRDLYRSLFHLPHSVHPRSAAPYTITTEDELTEDHALYHRAIETQTVTTIHRQVLTLTAPDNYTRIVECEMNLFARAERVVEPFNTTFRITYDAGAWRIARIISSLGHINWTLGKSAITNRKFELD